MRVVSLFFSFGGFGIEWAIADNNRSRLYPDGKRQ